MARIIELMGSPGVGKTTLYNKLVERASVSARWVPGESLFPKEKIWSKNLSSSILNILKVIFMREIPEDSAVFEEAGLRFIKENSTFIDKSLSSIYETHKYHLNGLDLRLTKCLYFYKQIQKIQIVRESPSRKIALVDEGLTQQVTSILNENDSSARIKSEIVEFFSNMQLPEGLIYVETDVDENAKRLRTRKKIISMHRSLGEVELKKVINSDLKKRLLVKGAAEEFGIPTLLICTNDDVATNVNKIISFLNTF